MLLCQTTNRRRSLQGLVAVSCLCTCNMDGIETNAFFYYAELRLLVAKTRGDDISQLILFWYGCRRTGAPFRELVILTSRSGRVAKQTTIVSPNSFRVIAFLQESGGGCRYPLA